MTERERFGSLTSFPAKGVRSLVWCGDELVDWVGGGTRWSLEGERQAASVFFAYKFDAAASTPDGEWAVIYEKLGTKALLLRHGRLVRELNRSYYCASSYEYPVCIWRHHDGRVLLCHCPEEYCRLEIEDAETGERLTTGDREPADFFHSRLRVTSDGRRLLTAGWVWHPWDAVGWFDVDSALEDATVLDKLDGVAQSRHIGLAEEASACWVTPSRVLLGGSEEPEDPEEAEENPGSRLRSKGVALYDLVESKILADVRLEEPAGTMMPVGADFVLCLYQHPRLVSLKTGEVVASWPEVSTGQQVGSIIHHIDPVPAMALQPGKQRLAIAADDKIWRLQFRQTLPSEKRAD